MPTYVLFAMIMQKRGTGNMEQGTGNGELNPQRYR